MRPIFGLLLALSALLGLGGCASAKIDPGRRLTLSLSPPELKPGQLIQVSAAPPAGVELAWVSGTVKVMGAPVMPFRKSEAGTWAFKTMIPAFASISPGTYEAKAWGDSLEGQRYEGSLLIKVK